MIKFENLQISGWESAIRGMRNPMNSWDRSDSGQGCNRTNKICTYCESFDNEREYGLCRPDKYIIGINDLKLMENLVKSGTDHRKFLRMIIVYIDITAPLYWWKEFDTYKVGTVANSCSTMHKIHAKDFSLDDFSYDHLTLYPSIKSLKMQVEYLNMLRKEYIETKDKKYWYEIIQLLPSSYNQKRTIMLNYEVLNNIYKSRKNHKLDEWSKGFITWIETLPYSKELITK